MSSYMSSGHSGSSRGEGEGSGPVSGKSGTGSSGTGRERCSVPEADELVFITARLTKDRVGIGGTYWCTDRGTFPNKVDTRRKDTENLAGTGTLHTDSR